MPLFTCFCLLMHHNNRLIVVSKLSEHVLVLGEFIGQDNMERLKWILMYYNFLLQLKIYAGITLGTVIEVQNPK